MHWVYRCGKGARRDGRSRWKTRGIIIEGHTQSESRRRANENRSQRRRQCVRCVGYTSPTNSYNQRARTSSAARSVCGMSARASWLRAHGISRRHIFAGAQNAGDILSWSARLLAVWGERWGADMPIGCLIEHMRAGGGGNEMASVEERLRR